MKTLLLSLFFFSLMLLLPGQQRAMRETGLESRLLHKDYRPKSVFNVPKTLTLKAKYSAIDIHHHAPRGKNLDSLASNLIRRMDETGIQKTILFCGTGKVFDEYAATFGKYPDRIELWCGLDLSNCNTPGFEKETIAELERCVKLGAKGVGEITDKGSGMVHDANPQLHIDDPRMDPILEKLADLKLPINFHSGDPKWMYEPIDEHNDLLFESLFFRLDNKTNILNLDQLTAALENAMKKHPGNTFIVCHFMNHTYDLDILGKLLNKYPNLYFDVSQREAYAAAIPRYAKQFIEKYADRVLYGTDQGESLSMYHNTFHIWETLDEHFYAWDVSNTPWPLSGVGLNDATLKKFYRDNALRILKK